MKFASLFLVGAVVASSTLSSVDATVKAAVSVRPGDEKKEEANMRKLKSKSSSSDDDSCSTCAQQLPGYSFFGENYLDKDFWDDIIDSTQPPPPFDTFPPEGRPLDVVDDFLIFPRFCYGPPGSPPPVQRRRRAFCGVLAFLSETIYESDLLRCLLMSLLTTSRDVICAAQEAGGVTNRRQLGEGKKKRPRLPQTIPANLDVGDLVMALFDIEGWETLGDIIEGWLDRTDPDLLELIESILFGAERKLNIENIRSSGDTTDDLLDGLLSDLDELFSDPDFELFVRGNSFLQKCIPEFSPPVCLGLFTLTKTIDATVCHYRETLGCGAETCTKDLAFDTAYNTERLAIDLPFDPPEDKIAADILSPCSGCLLDKSDGCAAFCPFYESLCSCELTNPTIAYIESPALLQAELGIDPIGLLPFLP